MRVVRDGFRNRGPGRRSSAGPAVSRPGTARPTLWGTGRHTDTVSNGLSKCHPAAGSAPYWAAEEAGDDLRRTASYGSMVRGGDSRRVAVNRSARTRQWAA